jgi:coenzyme PQQ precursor peptide PqqA
VAQAVACDQAFGCNRGAGNIAAKYHIPKIKSGHDMCHSHSLLLRFRVLRLYYLIRLKMEDTMAWTTPVLVEICIGLEINGYLPADGYVPPEF